ncbi:cuticle protein LPCP-23-like [Cylas formicarius]|uniref:cuticle protein LPCP-23-like n=1 Tax=Cylas formicarius TaxID=197179 RepID=UPI0029586A7C|nr:cuticle protein LPCP-23-like [Cylas formicarius]
MTSKLVVAFCVCLAAVANAGVFVGPSAKILQGPSSKTTVVGPDGSAISAVAPGGQIVHEEHPGVVAYAAPAAHLSYAAPAVVAHHAPVAHLAYSAPAVVAHQSAVVSHADTIVAGPSGTISTGRSIGQGVPVVAHSAGVVAHAAPVVAHASVLSNGHEGQYVHDYSESLYDDGSYKPHYYH